MLIARAARVSSFHRLACLSILALIAAAVPPAEASRAYSLSGGQLTLFDTGSPWLGVTASSSVPGLEGPHVAAITIRPRTGQIYALMVASPAVGARLYRIDEVQDPVYTYPLLRGVRVTQEYLPFPTVGGATDAALDFDPITDRAHIVTPGGAQYSVDPDTGAVTTLPVVPLRLAAVAYAHAVAGATSVPRYAIEVLNAGLPGETFRLVRLDTMSTPVPIGPSFGLPFAGAVGFDIRANDNAAFMIVKRLSQPSVLYRVDLATGGATWVAEPPAAVGPPMALQSRARMVYGVNTANQLVTFRSDEPGRLLTADGASTGTARAITGLQPGETIAALDARLSTGALYALSHQSRLYTLDPATSAATLQGALTIPLTGANPGLNVDPSTDSLRVTTATGQNLSSDFTGHAVPQAPLPAGFIAIAYDSNVRGAPSTTLYGIQALGSSALDQVAQIDALQGRLGYSHVMDLPAAVGPVGFDIAPGDDAAFLAAPEPGGSTSGWYVLELLSGKTSRIGVVAGGTALRAMAIAPQGYLRIVSPAATVTEGSHPPSGAPIEVVIERVAGTDGALPGRTYFYGSPIERFTLNSRPFLFPGGAGSTTLTHLAGYVLDDAVVQEPDELGVYLAETAPMHPRRPPQYAAVQVLDDDVVPVAPTVAIGLPTTGTPYDTRDPSVPFAGFVYPGTGAIRRVVWSSDRGASGVATVTPNPGGGLFWQGTNVTLSPGANVLTVTVEDSSVPALTAAASVTVNMTEPVVPTYYLTEGATGLFTLDLAIANPHETPAPITLRFLDEQDPTLPQVTRVLPPRSRTTVRVNDLPGMGQRTFSTVVSSTGGLPLVVERTMRWDAQRGYGMSTDSAVRHVATRWYFAEGAQGFFNTYLLLSNPDNVLNRAVVRFLRENAPPVTQTVFFQPGQRVSIDAGSVATGPDGPLLSGAFGIEAVFDRPGLAERVMYFGQDPFWKGGDGTAGVTAPADNWYFAEGATGSYWLTFLLLVNPNEIGTAAVDVTYMTTSGVTVQKRYDIEPQQRVSINVAGEDPRLTAATVGTKVHANMPILAERTQYWGGQSPHEWLESHNSFGVTAPARDWGVAEGRLGGPEQFSSYILIANPGEHPATIRATFLREGGLPPIVREPFTIGPNSRLTLFGEVGVDGLQNERFSAIISSDEPVVVERAMYSDALGQHWKAGTNSPGTPLAPPVP